MRAIHGFDLFSTFSAVSFKIQLQTVFFGAPHCRNFQEVLWREHPNWLWIGWHISYHNTLRNNIYIWTQQLETPGFVEDVIDVPEKRMLVGSEMLINLVDLRKQSADRRAICLFVAQLFYDHIGQVFMTREKVGRRWHVFYFVMLWGSHYKVVPLSYTLVYNLESHELTVIWFGN